MTVRQLKQFMDSKELSKWMAFFKVESEEKQEDPSKFENRLTSAVMLANRKDS